MTIVQGHRVSTSRACNDDWLTPFDYPSENTDSTHSDTQPKPPPGHDHYHTLRNEFPLPQPQLHPLISNRLNTCQSLTRLY